ncbi:glycosyltransferase [Oceanicella sp. SM1341]|uniref:glycosyltransferase n=1 Tax=Oceanicella sp. SM1341 TaxID=1548889 RepID=UPI000E48DD6E|nr:glycosyltransferase [Oceanicella sp. SM1341]
MKDHSFRSREIVVALVCSEILGPYLGGGIATSVFGLTTLLARKYRVCVIYLGSYSGGWDVERARAYYSDLGVEFIDPRASVDPDVVDLSDVRTSSWLALEALRELRPELAVFHEYGALGYYPALDKAQNGDLAGTRILTVLHGPARWARTINGDLTPSKQTYVQDFMERRAVELSDHVSSPSQYIYDWCLRDGWALDAARHTVERNIVPLHPIEHYLTHPVEEDVVAPRPAGAPWADVEEFVFFGRLEQRKGIVSFCNALDRLVQIGLHQPRKVTFLGRGSVLNGMDSTAYVIERSRKWPFEISFLETCTQSEALDYLTGPGRLGVMPSVEENAPCVVVECVNRGVPMLCSTAGGTQELLRPADAEAIALPLQRAAMADRLIEALTDGVPTARLSYTHAEAIEAWSERIDALLAQPGAPAAAPDAADPQEPPLVSVVITHYNRLEMLRLALNSVFAQDYPEIEVVIVDDGSRPGVQAELVKTWGKHPKVRIVRQENAYLGAARNAGVREARGTFVKFMDDDNISLPDEISQMVRVALHTDSDIVTCFAQWFRNPRPKGREDITGYYLPLGGGETAQLFDNFMGDANALVRRSMFEEIGGFTEEYGQGFEDYEFFARAALMGRRTTVVPRPLFWYRLAEDSMLQGGQGPELLLFNRNRVARMIRAHADRLPVSTVQDLVEMSSAAVLAQQTAYAREQIWRSSEVPDYMKRLRTGGSWGEQRREDLVRLMIACGRLKEAVRYMGGNIPGTLVESFSRKLVDGTSFITGASILSENRLANQTFEGVQEAAEIEPYGRLCEGWYVPQANAGPTQAFSPLEEGGLRIAVSDMPESWAPGSYRLLRTDVPVRGFDMLEGTNLDLLARADGDYFRLKYFLRIHKGGEFTDYWSEVSIGREWGHVSDLLRFDEAAVAVPERMELFLQLYFDFEAALEIRQIGLQLCGRADWARPGQVLRNGVVSA